MAKMRKLKRSECAVQHLVLKGEWYDMIDRGEKKEEYRADKPHWSGRLERWIDRPEPHVVAFQRGYRKPSMWFICNGISTCDTAVYPEWGEPNEPHYIIFLGERVKLED